MSAEKFQSLLAELVAGGSVPPHSMEGLTAMERQRLEAVTEQDGIQIMRTLYFSWRLTKILTLLPFTAALMGDEKLALYLKDFWSRRNATSLYFVEECLAFLSFLKDTLLEDLPHFESVSAFERARLELRLEISKGKTFESREVYFHCNPSSLFEALGNGGDLSNLPVLDVVLRGSLTSGGREEWTVVGSDRSIQMSGSTSVVS